MDATLLPKSMFLGFAIAAPVGPIGLLCLRRSLTSGFRAGFSSGLGAAAADFLYGLAAAFGVGTLASLVQSATPVLAIVAGCFLVWLGVKVCREQPGRETHTTDAGFAATFLLTVVNPATILSASAVMSTLKAGAEPLPVALGMFVGSASWWLCLAGGGAFLRDRLRPCHLLWINRFSGAIVTLLGAVQLAPEAWAAGCALFTYLSNHAIIS